MPEVASRRHIEMIDIVIREALEKAGKELEEIDIISVTNRPGLIGSLLVGVGAAKAISYAKDIPLIAVNHLEAHLYSNLLENPGMEGDFLGLIVSGGHSSLYLVDSEWNINEIGHTVDDAAGEAFDKIARYLGLGYPGGPVIDKMSKNGNEQAIDLPRPMIDSGDFNFSFSGLKTALIYRTMKNNELLSESNVCDLVASFQKAIVDVLVRKTVSAAKETGVDRVLVSGGVAANSRLREELVKKGEENNIRVYIPSLYLCMDNAAMVGCLGYFKYLRGLIDDLEVDVSSKSDF